jgi:hypothetical protein
MKIAPLTFITCSLLISIAAFAQDETDSLQTDLPKSYFKASLEYLNNSVYLGRKDSVNIPYLTPEISYHFKSGFFLNASASYLPAESRIDESTIGGGYAFSKKKWDGEFSAEKYFYSSKSYNVKAETKGDVSATIDYDAGFITPGISTFIDFSAKNDYGGSFSLEHDFSLFHDNMDLSPSFVVNASTQNSYAQYYQKRKYAKTKKGKALGYSVTANTFNTSNFKILDYEFSVPIDYTVKRFTLSFTPVYAIPVNPNTVVLTIKTLNGNTNTKTFTENLGNSFYWSFGVAYKIKEK